VLDASTDQDRPPPTTNQDRPPTDEGRNSKFRKKKTTPSLNVSTPLGFQKRRNLLKGGSVAFDSLVIGLCGKLSHSISLGGTDCHLS
jgi:hypothetical protein